MFLHLDIFINSVCFVAFLQQTSMLHEGKDHLSKDVVEWIDGILRMEWKTLCYARNLIVKSKMY